MLPLIATAPSSHRYELPATNAQWMQKRIIVREGGKATNCGERNVNTKLLGGILPVHNVHYKKQFAARKKEENRDHRRLIDIITDGDDSLLLSIIQEDDEVQERKKGIASFGCEDEGLFCCRQTSREMPVFDKNTTMLMEELIDFSRTRAGSSLQLKANKAAAATQCAPIHVLCATRILALSRPFQLDSGEGSEPTSTIDHLLFTDPPAISTPYDNSNTVTWRFSLVERTATPPGTFEPLPVALQVGELGGVRGTRIDWMAAADRHADLLPSVNLRSLLYSRPSEDDNTTGETFTVLLLDTAPPLAPASTPPLDPWLDLLTANAAPGADTRRQVVPDLELNLSELFAVTHRRSVLYCSDSFQHAFQGAGKRKHSAQLADRGNKDRGNKDRGNKDRGNKRSKTGFDRPAVTGATDRLLSGSHTLRCIPIRPSAQAATSPSSLLSHSLARLTRGLRPQPRVNTEGMNLSRRVHRAVSDFRRAVEGAGGGYTYSGRERGHRPRPLRMQAFLDIATISLVAEVRSDQEGVRADGVGSSAVGGGGGGVAGEGVAGTGAVGMAVAPHGTVHGAVHNTVHGAAHNRPAVPMDDDYQHTPANRTSNPAHVNVDMTTPAGPLGLSQITAVTTDTTDTTGTAIAATGTGATGSDLRSDLGSGTGSTTGVAIPTTAHARAPAPPTPATVTPALMPPRHASDPVGAVGAVPPVPLSVRGGGPAPAHHLDAMVASYMATHEATVAAVASNGAQSHAHLSTTNGHGSGHGRDHASDRDSDTVPVRQPLKPSHSPPPLTTPTAHSTTSPPLITPALTGTHKAGRMDGLQVLVSEHLMENRPSLLALLSANHGITSLDCPLEQPLAMVVDVAVGVVVVDLQQVIDRATLKSFIRQLTTLTFKFKRLWVVVEEPRGVGPNATLAAAGMASLFSSISQFRLDIVVRSSNASALPAMLFAVCNDTAKVACSLRDCLRTQFHARPFLEPLLSSDSGHDSIAFMEHCAFLQQFPTINYYLAAQLLGSAFLAGATPSLGEFMAALPEKHDALMTSMRPYADSATAAEISAKFLEPFYALLTVHSGLEVVPGIVGVGGGGVSPVIGGGGGGMDGAGPAADLYHTPQMQRQVEQQQQQLQQHQLQQQQNRHKQYQQHQQHQHGQQFSFDDTEQTDLPPVSHNSHDHYPAHHPAQPFYGAPGPAPGPRHVQSSFIEGCEYEDDDDDDYSGNYKYTNPPPLHANTIQYTSSTERYPEHDNRYYQRY